MGLLTPCNGPAFINDSQNTIFLTIALFVYSWVQRYLGSNTVFVTLPLLTITMDLKKRCHQNVF